MGYLDALFSDPRISSLLSGTPTSGGGNLYGPPARAPLNNTFTPEYFAQMFGGQKPSIPQGYSPSYGPQQPAYSVLNPKPVGGGALIPQGYSPSYGPPPPQYSVLNPQPVGGSLPAPTAPWNTLTEAGGGRRFFEPVNTFSSSNTGAWARPLRLRQTEPSLRRLFLLCQAIQEHHRAEPGPRVLVSLAEMPLRAAL